MLAASAVPGSFACISRHCVESHFAFISACLHSPAHMIPCLFAVMPLKIFPATREKIRKARIAGYCIQLLGIFAASVTEYLNILTCTTLSAVFPNTGINMFVMFFFLFFFLPGCQQRIMCCPCCFCLQKSNFNMPFFLWQNRNR